MKPYKSKEYLNIREVVLWLWDHVCHICKQPSNTLDVHHLDGNNQNNVITNVAPACRQCHQMLHRISLRWPIKKLTIAFLLIKKINQFLPHKFPRS